MEVQPDQKTINIIRVGTIEETVITFDLTNSRLNKKYMLLSPPYQKNGKWYLPVVDTCRHLGLGGRYEKNTNTVFINPRVKEVYVESVNGQKKIVIVATDTIFDQKVYENEKKDQLIIDLPHTHLDVPSKLLPFDDPSISQIRLGQFEADTVRVMISLKAPLTYGLGSKPSGRALEIGFANWITDIKWEATPDSLAVKIKATAPLKYSQNYFKNPDRFILEFQEAVLKTQPLQLVGQFGLQQIRASQFSYAPLTSRIVFDLEKYQPLKVTEGDGGKELTILFTLKTAPETTPTSPETVLSVFGGSPFNPSGYNALKGKKIVVSAGHGGTDPGSIFGGTEEKVFTLQTSNKLKELLIKVGAIPLMAREDDQFVSMEDRCRFANGNAADALVDIHFNSFIKEEISGTETYYYKNKDYPLAQKIHQEILKIFNRQDKGLKKAQMYTLNHTQMPGVLVEPLYLSNKDELNLIKETVNQEKLARAILDGLNEYFKNPGVVAQ
jgi:N-acetylmuramoyl-L-alanine amidase